MAKLVYGLNQSLDGYVDHMKIGPPHPALFRHFIEQTRGLTGMLYGRRMYEIMRYWDDDLPDWDAEDRDFAAVWRSQPKWVVSRSLKSVGPNATLVENVSPPFRRFGDAALLYQTARGIDEECDEQIGRFAKWHRNGTK